MENSNGEYERSTTCMWWMISEDCVTKILGFTSPLDVCRFSLVSKSVGSAAECDIVWEKFLPSDYQSIVAASLSPIPDFPSKKNLYVYLCHHPLLIDGGRKSFSLDKWTGKKCYLLGARDLHVAGGDNPEHWKWYTRPESRFPEVVELVYVWWLEVRGTIRAGILSPRTSYAAYLVYKLENEYGFHSKPAEVSVVVSGVELDKRFAFLVPDGTPPWLKRSDETIYTFPSYAEDEPWQPDDYEESVYTLPSDAEDKPVRPEYDYEDSVYTIPSDEEDDRMMWHLPEDATSSMQRAKLRDDGWLEIELGEFFTENEDDCIEMSMKEVKDCISSKNGLIVEGIEIRPRMYSE